MSWFAPTSSAIPAAGSTGKALAEALSGPNVFACSHLGGHRFAPTALVLPTGYLYGHLDPRSATAVLAGAAAGEVEVDHCRGRSTWSPTGQVAELAVRAATGLRSPDALVVPDDTGDTVRLGATSGDRWAVDVERVDADRTRPASCGARGHPDRAAASRGGARPPVSLLSASRLPLFRSTGGGAR